MFKLHSEYTPTGDQPQAIEYLSNGIMEGKKFQTLLGVTGSRKNFYNGKYYRKSAKAHTRFST
jgi:excinuclease ABC subunit B